MFADFEDAKTGQRVAVNTDYLVYVRPGESKDTTILVDRNGAEREVKGGYVEVLRKLNA